MDNNPILERYADLSKRIKELESQRETLKAEVLDIMDDMGQKHLSTAFGSFSWQERRTYEYSSKVKQLEDQLKTVKKSEEKEENLKAVTRFPVFREKED